MSNEGTGTEGQTPGAAAEGEFGRPKADRVGWVQEAEGLCSYLGSSPDCALGLTP